MNYEKQTDDLIFNERISYVFLLFLLLIRFFDYYLPLWLFDAIAPEWFSHWYAGIIYILTAAIVWLNRHRASQLNIDRLYIVALILGGIFYTLNLVPYIGVWVGVAAGIVTWAYQKNHFSFQSTASYVRPTKISILFLFLAMLSLVPAVYFALDPKMSIDTSLILDLFLSVLQIQLGAIVFEELIFRGISWAYLRGLGFGEKRIFYFQAFLFWTAHHKALLSDNPYYFWAAIPISALLLGLIAWRSKSIGLSTIGHFLYNFIGQIISKLF